MYHGYQNKKFNATTLRISYVESSIPLINIQVKINILRNSINRNQNFGHLKSIFLRTHWFYCYMFVYYFYLNKTRRFRHDPFFWPARERLPSRRRRLRRRDAEASAVVPQCGVGMRTGCIYRYTSTIVKKCPRNVNAK